MREISGGGGYTSQNDLRAHFGLADATNVETLRIEWPSGTVQELHDLASGRFLAVTEPGGEPHLALMRVNGQVQLTLTGKQGFRYDIETSPDLANWTSALSVTVTNPSGTLIFPAPGETSDPRRFYRATLK
jgi:hypothetical protein